MITSILPTQGGKPAQMRLSPAGHLWLVNFGAGGAPNKPYGIECYDIATDPAHPARVSFTGSPTFAWFNVEQIRFVGTTMFALSNDGAARALHSVDTSTPSAPTNVGSTIALDGSSYDFDLNPAGTIAVVSQLAGAGLRIVDVSTPAVMPIIASVAGAFIAVDCTFWPYVLVSETGTGELRVYDLTTPSAPVLAGSLALSTNIRRMVVNVAEKVVFVATTNSQIIYVVGLGNLSIPQLVTTIPCSIAGDDTPIRLVTSGDKFCLTTPMNAQDFNPASCWTYDVTNPSTPSLVQVFQYGNILYDCLVSGDYAYLGNRGGGQELVTVNVSDVIPQ